MDVNGFVNSQVSYLGTFVVTNKKQINLTSNGGGEGEGRKEKGRKMEYKEV